MSDVDDDDDVLESLYEPSNIPRPTSATSLIDHFNRSHQRIGLGASFLVTAAVPSSTCDNNRSSSVMLNSTAVHKSGSEKPEATGQESRSKSNVTNNMNQRYSSKDTNIKGLENYNAISETVPNKVTKNTGTAVDLKSPAREVSDEKCSSHPLTVKTQPSDSSGYSSMSPPDQTLTSPGLSACLPETLKNCVSERSLPSKKQEHSLNRTDDSVELLSGYHDRDLISSDKAQSQGAIRTTFVPGYSSLFSDLPENRNISQETGNPVEDVIDKIQKFTSCRSKNCSNDKCRAGKRIIEEMTNFLINYYEYQVNMDAKHMYGTAIMAIDAIQRHSEDCDELKCQVPLCYFFTVNDISECPHIYQLRRIKEEYFSGLHQLMNPILKTPVSGEKAYFLKLGYDKVKYPKEDIDYNNLTRVGNYGNAVLAHTEGQYWFVKRAYITDSERHSHLQKVVKCIHLNDHQHIVPHLWCLTYDKYFFYATPWGEFVSLADKLISRKDGFPSEACWRLMDQMVNAAMFLQSNNILYLNWRCKCIMFNEATGIAQITNFTNSVVLPVEDKSEDIGHLALWLPAHLVPPEIYRESSIGLKSEVWGLAAVLYEMATGNQIHEHYSHEEPQYVRDTLKETPVVNIDAVSDPDIKKLLRRSFKVSVSSRIHVQDMKQTIQDSLATFSGY